MPFDTTAWITIGLNLVMASVYYAVGRVISRREVSPDAELAKKSFSGFWYALSVITGGGAVSTAIFFTVGSIEAVNPATGETHLLGEEGVWTPEMDGLVP